MKRAYVPISYQEEREIFREIMENPNIVNEIKKNIYLKGIMKDFEEIETLDKNTAKYSILKNRIINVDEYEN